MLQPMELFGSLDALGDGPKADPLKWALTFIVCRGHFDMLARFLSSQPDVPGFSGDGGWSLSHRLPEDEWPDAEVDEDDWSLSPLAHWRFYFDRETMRRYLKAAIEVYMRHHPDRREGPAEVLALLRWGTA